MRAHWLLILALVGAVVGMLAVPGLTREDEPSRAVASPEEGEGYPEDGGTAPEDEGMPEDEGLGADDAAGEDPGSTEPEADPASYDEKKQAEEYAKFVELGKPGPAHQILSQLAGTWTVQTTEHHGQGATVQSTASAEHEIVLDGRFLQIKHDGTMGGLPFNGKGLIGHNNLKKQYELVWADNWRSNLWFVTGTASADGKSLVFEGTMPCPSGGEDLPSRLTYTITSPTAFSFVMEMQMDGAWQKGVESQYTR